MLRIYSKDWREGEELPTLEREEQHHLFKVRRIRPGEEVEVLNGRGLVGLARYTGAGEGSPALDLREQQTISPRPLQVHLAVAVPKGKTFPALLQKAVELGAAEITPLLTENVEAPPGRLAGKTGRWESVLIEALKQSGNPWMPTLHPPCGLEAFLQSGFGGQRLCAALHDEARPLRSLLGEGIADAGELQVFVGPEGDFSIREYRLLKEAGCRFASLGPLVLRVETAASLLLGILNVWGNAVAR